VLFRSRSLAWALGLRNAHVGDELELSRSKGKIWLLIFGVTFAILISIALYLNPYKVGRVLGEYKGVQIIENGLVFYKNHGKNYSFDGYYYGQKWQCTEYVKRFYYDVYGHKMPDVWGHAKDYYDPSVSHGALNSKRGMLQFRNGGDIAPQPDDLLVFTDTKYGHVAIVSEIKADNVMVKQQNILGKPTEVYRLRVTKDGNFIDYPRVPSGWLRVPIPQCTNNCHGEEIRSIFKRSLTTG